MKAEYMTIEVQDPAFGFDGVHRVVLDGRTYFIRFTYNDTADSWKYSLYDSMMDPLLLSVRIVPSFPMDIFYVGAELPNGYFVVLTDLKRIGRDSFKSGEARFAFFPSSGVA